MTRLGLAATQPSLLTATNTAKDIRDTTSRREPHLRMSAIRLLTWLAFALVVVSTVACGRDGTTSGLSTSPSATAEIEPTVQTRTLATVAPAPAPSSTTVPTNAGAPVASPPTITPSTPRSTAALPSSTPDVAQPRDIPSIDGTYGGTLNLVSRQVISHQDIHLEVSPALAVWGPGLAYSRMLRLRSGAGVELPSMEVECVLCENWTMLDPTTFEFELREGVRWHDIPPVNGRPLSAGDIEFSYNRQRLEGLPNSPVLRAISSITARSSSTVEISLKFPDSDLMLALADGHSKIVAPEAVARSGDLKNGPTIGTGPWILVETNPNLGHVFDQNPDYFEEGFPFVQRLNVNTIEDQQTRNAAFRVRNIDIQQLDPAEWKSLRSQLPNLPFLMTRESGSGVELALKTTVPPFDDVRVRNALFFALDPWRTNRDIWQDAAYVSLGFPAVSADWNLPDKELAAYFGDAQKARGLMVEASPGKIIPFSLKVGDFGETYIRQAERVAEEIREVGFEPTLEIVSRRAFGEDVWLRGNYEAFIGPIAPVSTPNGYFVPVLHSQGRWNTTGLIDTELDTLIERQAREFDLGARRELVHEIQRRVLGNAYRFMPSTRISIWVFWPRVQNFNPNVAGLEYDYWSRVWLR